MIIARNLTDEEFIAGIAVKVDAHGCGQRIAVGQRFRGVEGIAANVVKEYGDMIVATLVIGEQTRIEAIIRIEIRQVAIIFEGEITEEPIRLFDPSGDPGPRNRVDLGEAGHQNYRVRVDYKVAILSCQRGLEGAPFPSHARDFVGHDQGLGRRHHAHFPGAGERGADRELAEALRAVTLTARLAGQRIAIRIGQADLGGVGCAIKKEAGVDLVQRGVHIDRGRIG